MEMVFLCEFFTIQGTITLMKSIKINLPFGAIVSSRGSLQLVTSFIAFSPCLPSLSFYRRTLRYPMPRTKIKRSCKNGYS
jgi:hypothetical protein